MSQIPKFFRKSGASIATYDVFDIISGTGYISLYAGVTNDLDVLSNVTFYSDKVETYGARANANYGVIADVDFDVVINKPMALRGTGIVSIPAGMKNLGSSDTFFSYGRAFLYHIRDGTETTIINNDTRILTGTLATSAYMYTVFTTDLVIPLTLLKKDDTLRIKIQIFGKSTAAQNGMFFFGHDPMSRTDTPHDSTITWGTNETTLKLLLPIRIDL